MVLSHSSNQASICFIDTNVSDHDVLLQGIRASVEVILLNSHQDGLLQITEALATRPEISVIHIIAHGSPGTLYLGNSELSLTTLDRYTEYLKAWFNPKSKIQNPKPALLLYACNVAAGDAGEEFITKLHQVTGASIAASTTRVGNAALGGNWNLDYRIAHPCAAIAFTRPTQQAYAGVLNLDTDGDGIADTSDLDDDNDGMLDTEEGFGVVTSVASINTNGYTYDTNVSSQTLTGLGQTGSNSFSFKSELQGSATWGTSAVRLIESGFGLTDFIQVQPKDTNLLGGANIAVYTFTYEKPTPMSLVIGGLNNDDAVSFRAFNGTTEIPLTSANFVNLASTVSELSGFPPNTYGTSNTDGGVDPTVNEMTFIIDQPITELQIRSGKSDGDAGNVTLGFHTLTYGTTSSGQDTDLDGVEDHLDLDSDNDGISDLVESGADAATLDPDSNGFIDGAQFTDGDGDGLADSIESANGADTGTTPIDSETTPDGIPDYRDLDSDDDGIPDTVEARPTAGYTTNDGDVTNNDADGDGVIDQFDANDGTTGDFGGTFATPVNTDGTDNPDYLDTDSDNDGIDDINESGLTLSGNDDNGDGIDDAVNASPSDPNGDINNPLNDLANVDADNSDVDYRSLDGTAPFIDLNATTNLTFSAPNITLVKDAGNNSHVNTVARYNNVGTTAGGQSIDMVATIVAHSNPDPSRGVLFGVSGNDFQIDIPGISGQTVNVTVEYQFVVSGTGTDPVTNPAILVDVPEFKFTIKDFDDVSQRTESVTASGISSYAVNDPTEVDIADAGGNFTFTGTTQNTETDADAAVELIYNTRNTFQVTYTSVFKQSNQAGFVHDGNGEFTFTSPAITVLDDTINDYSTVFTEDGPPVNVADPTAADINDFAENDITSLIIVVDPTKVVDGGAEIVSIGGTDFSLDTDVTTPVQVTVGATQLNITYDSTVGRFVLVASSGGSVLPQGNLDILLRGITYRNTLDEPTPGDRTLEFTATDLSGAISTPTAVSTITVIPINDPPVLDLDDDNSSLASGSGYQVTFTEGGNAVAIADSDTTITDADDTNIESATITLTNAQTGDILSGASLPAGTGISIDGASTNTQIILTGSGTLAEYQAAIASITFGNTEANPNTSDRTITVVVNDGTDDSNTAT
ncbi:MAG: DUF4347 domain-containing protein, partial [Synechococcales bacterium]|nr:DUF4347 domain-containing protein [Synechococcales bacterium]